MLSLLDIIQKSAGYLEQHGVERGRLEAEHLIGHALGLKRMQLYVQFERLLTEPELERIRPLVRRRGQREPLSYILGDTEFAGLRLKTDRRALVPRPETEELVELLATRLKASPPARILDLGTGTGALALGLAHAFAAAAVTATDASAEALALARENAAGAGLDARVRFVRGDWFGALDSSSAGEGGAPFDLIVSNPPYLTEDEWASAEPEVRDHEPRGALVAADAGLADLRRIIAAAPRWLAPGGLLALETGIDQHAALAQACAAAGLRDCESVRDLSKRDRFVLARRS